MWSSPKPRWGARVTASLAGSGYRIFHVPARLQLKEPLGSLKRVERPLASLAPTLPGRRGNACDRRTAMSAAARSRRAPGKGDCRADGSEKRITHACGRTLAGRVSADDGAAILWGLGCRRAGGHRPVGRAGSWPPGVTWPPRETAGQCRAPDRAAAGNERRAAGADLNAPTSSLWARFAAVEPRGSGHVPVRLALLPAGARARCGASGGISLRRGSSRRAAISPNDRDLRTHSTCRTVR